MSRYDVVVVGGGAMGAATAYAAASRGATVALVEQFGAGHDRGSSHGRSRIFRLAYRESHFVALAQRALSLWRALSDDCGEELLQTTGGVDHGDPAALEAIATSLRSAGAAASLMTADEAMARWPGMRFAGDVLYQPDAGRVDADATVAALHRRAAELGADVCDDERVHELRESETGVDVVTDGRTLTARVAVLAAGAWLPSLAASLPLSSSLPALTITQEQPAYFDAPDADRWPVFVHYADRPRYGLFTPAYGVKVGEHGTGLVLPGPDVRPPADEARVRRLAEYVDAWLPGADPTPSRVDTCLYTTTPDEEFVLRRFGRVVVCSACSGHGFKFVPAIGEITAGLALGD